MTKPTERPLTDQEVLEYAAKDARRYRFLRSREWDDIGVIRLHHGPDFTQLQGEALDAAIDAAMSKEKE